MSRTKGVKKSKMSNLTNIKQKKNTKNKTINEQIQNIAQKKDTLCRRMYN